MGKVLQTIDNALAGFLCEQPMFFVATAPAALDGHVNLSPKGLTGSFAVLDSHTVAYVDLTGSGAETLAHLRENGRICLMFCAFAGPPRIVRLHGQGAVTLPADPGFGELAARFPSRPGIRSVVTVTVERLSDSCGFAVPLMTYERDRDQLVRWADHKGAAGLEEYRGEKNATSIDGLPTFL